VAILHVLPKRGGAGRSGRYGGGHDNAFASLIDDGISVVERDKGFLGCLFDLVALALNFFWCEIARLGERRLIAVSYIIKGCYGLRLAVLDFRIDTPRFRLGIERTLWWRLGIFWLPRELDVAWCTLVEILEPGLSLLLASDLARPP
jgi:hypothetical protein